uniref:BPTI/Kunitz inhibitor domain-containing protein n=1 Tax=Macrostomum lignano TaxID=282301 RepID=A0A1I8I8A7_9PLAT
SATPPAPDSKLKATAAIPSSNSLPASLSRIPRHHLATATLRICNITKANNRRSKRAQCSLCTPSSPYWSCCWQLSRKARPAPFASRDPRASASWRGPRAKRFLYNSGGGCEAFEVQCFNHVDCMAQYRSPSYMCAVGECKSTCVPVPRQ